MKSKPKKTAQEIQDEIFRKMPISKKINKQKVYFISPEDLVLNKLVWYQKSGESSRHIEDVESVFKISGKKLDKNYLKKQAAKMGVVGLLKKIME